MEEYKESSKIYLKDNQPTFKVGCLYHKLNNINFQDLLKPNTNQTTFSKSDLIQTNYNIINNAITRYIITNFINILSSSCV